MLLFNNITNIREVGYITILQLCPLLTSLLPAVHSQSELCNGLAQVPVYFSRNITCSTYFDRHLMATPAVITTVSLDCVKKTVLVKHHYHLCVCVEQMESCPSAVICRWLNVGVCVGGITACTNTRHDWLKTH